MSDTFALRTPVGILEIHATPTALKEIRFNGRKKESFGEPASRILQRAVRQLREYFDGRRRDFDLPLEPEGTRFQLGVWSELRRIPYGQTITYGELASRVGNP
jgi:methylated-DNA-[protein]-cysteine S-methyltransferase